MIARRFGKERCAAWRGLLAFLDKLSSLPGHEEVEKCLEVFRAIPRDMSKVGMAGPIMSELEKKLEDVADRLAELFLAEFGVRKAAEIFSKVEALGLT